MLTINADSHPLMRRMHKPDLDLASDKQDKRSVVVIEASDFDAWLGGTADDVTALIRLAPVELIVAGPEAAPTAEASAGKPTKPSAKRATFAKGSRA